MTELDDWKHACFILALRIPDPCATELHLREDAEVTPEAAGVRGCYIMAADRVQAAWHAEPTPRLAELRAKQSPDREQMTLEPAA